MMPISADAMPALFGVTVDESFVVEAEAERAVVFDVARRETVGQSVVAARTFAFREHGTKMIPVPRDVAAEDFARHRGDDRKRGGIAVVFRSVEKDESRQMPQTRGDLRRRKIECDRARRGGLDDGRHADAIGQMRGLFKSKLRG